MIIYGHRQREREVAEGEFSCPRCQARRPYKHKRLVRYLTLFFIPTIPLGSLGEKVECQVCFNAFPPPDIFRPVEGTPGTPPTIRPPRSQTKRGWVLIVLGAIVAMAGGLIALFTVYVQLTSPAGPLDNWQGSLGVLVICPLPLILAGLALAGRGGYLAWKVRSAWESVCCKRNFLYSAVVMQYPK
jgi:hypothetical protein